jgi:hypothetical protein
LVAGVLAEPAEQVGVEAHGHDFFWRGQYDFGVFPEGGGGGAGVGIGAEGAADFCGSLTAQAGPVGGGCGFGERSVRF